MDAITGPVIGLAVIVSLALLGLMAIVWGFLNARRQQQMVHLERMKALEMGREVPDEVGIARARVAAEAASEKSHAGKCFSTTGLICFWGFLFAVGAAAKDGGNAIGAAYALAAAAGAVGVTGLICGTVLALKAADEPEVPVKARSDRDEF